MHILPRPNLEGCQWVQIAAERTEELGHRLCWLNIPDDRRAEAITALADALDAIWSGEFPEDPMYQDCRALLMEIAGVDLDTVVKSRGRSEPADRNQLVMVDKGDLIEVIAHIYERALRGFRPEDLFFPILFEKRSAGSTVHGLDGLGFAWSDSDSPVLDPAERIVIHEATHTSGKDSIGNACAEKVSFWSSITPQKLYQELRRVQSIYKTHGEARKARRCMLFLVEFAMPSSQSVTRKTHIAFDASKTPYGSTCERCG